MQNKLTKKKSRPRTKKKVAIFDIDGTVFRSSLLIELTEALAREGIFPDMIRGQYRSSRKRWSDRTGSYHEYIMSVVAAFQKNIKGVKYSDFQKVSASVIEEYHGMTYVYTRELIKKLKTKGYYLLAVSHSPKVIVEEFARTLGFDKTYGRIYEVGKNGVFTGRGLYEDEIFDKAKILERAMLKEGLTLTDSVGVGDTEADIAFLSIVKKPICFNPNQELYNVAKKRGWKVVVERKDVVYEL